MKRRAFSLIELLMSLAVAAMVMMSCVWLFLSMAKLSESAENAPELLQKATSAEKFLRCAFVNSSFPQRMPEELVGNMHTTTGTIRIGQYPENTDTEELNLCFGIERFHPLFLAADGFAKEKICWLKFEKDTGLFVIWTFVDLEYEKTERTIYKTKISDCVADVSYMFYSEEYGWQEEETIPQNSDNAGLIPHYIKIVFSDSGKNLTRYIPLYSFLEGEKKASARERQSGRRGVVQYE